MIVCQYPGILLFIVKQQLRKQYLSHDVNKKTGNERTSEIMRDKRSRGIVIF